MSDEVPTSGKEPGGWELYRLMLDIKKTLEKVVTVEVMHLYQEGNDRRHQESEKRQAAWEAKSEAEHTRLDGKIDNLEDKFATQEREQRASRQRTWLSVALAIFGATVSIGIALLGRGGA